MAVDLRFVLTGAKRVFDSRPMYAQLVVTDDCNLTCTYCDEYTTGAPIIPLEELKGRIAKTLAFIESVKPAQIDGSEEREIVLKLRAGDKRLAGLQYLFAFAYPNFYFHLTTAYNILRHNGVEIGKKDFVGEY